MCTLDGSKRETGADEDDLDVLLMLNAENRDALFYLPLSPHQGKWRLAIDTALPSPYDIHPHESEVELEPTLAYQVKARSVVVLVAAWGPKILWPAQVRVPQVLFVDKNQKKRG